jgi:hypothetical protein
VDRVCYPVMYVLECPGSVGGFWVSGPLPLFPAAEALLPAVLGAVRACTWLYVESAAGSPGARTYGVQRVCRQRRVAPLAQVSDYVEVQAGAYCKTVGPS